MQRKNITKDYIPRIGIEIISQISILIVIIFISKQLDIIDFAILSHLSIYLTIVNIICFWGFLPYLLEVFILKKFNFFLIIANEIIKIKLIISFTLSFLFSLLLFTFFKDYILCISFLLASIAASMLPINFFQAINESKQLFKYYLISRVFFIFFSLLLIRDSNDIFIFFLIHFFSSFFLVIIGYLKLKKYGFYFDLKINLKLKKLILLKSFNHFLSIILNNQILLIWGFVLSFSGKPNFIALFNLNLLFLKAGFSFSEIIGRISSSFTPINDNKKSLYFVLKNILFYTIIFLFLLFVSDSVILFFFKGQGYNLLIDYIDFVLLIWYLNAIYKSINYNFDLDKINFLNKYLLYSNLIHVPFLLVWFLYFSTSLKYLFIFVIFSYSLQIIFCLFILKRLVNKNFS